MESFENMNELYEKVCVGIEEYDVLHNRLYGIQKDIPRRILLILIHHMSNDNVLVTSLGDLSKITHFKKDNISKALSFLKKEGWIDVIKCGMSLMITVNTSKDVTHRITSGRSMLCANALFYLEDDMQSEENEEKNPLASVGENCIYNIKNMDTDELYKMIL